jgi:hypothetical protein
MSEREEDKKRENEGKKGERKVEKNREMKVQKIGVGRRKEEKDGGGEERGEGGGEEVGIFPGIVLNHLVLFLFRSQSWLSSFCDLSKLQFSPYLKPTVENIILKGHVS